MVSALVYSIDFGTSNSTVSVWDGQAATVVPAGDHGVVRSVLYFGDERHAVPTVGREGIH
ncbi:MAG: hypothetical protein GF331_07870, partial [Chitinivibrionales bacterium]|nr:hypothetical protein [Chitinivibrionales bacterium]